MREGYQPRRYHDSACRNQGRFSCGLTRGIGALWVRGIGALSSWYRRAFLAYLIEIYK